MKVEKNTRAFVREGKPRDDSAELLCHSQWMKFIMDDCINTEDRKSWG